MAEPDQAGGAEAHALRERARGLLDLGRADEALETAQRALIADPSSAESEMLIARCAANLDRPHDAIRHSTRASSLDPQWALPHVLRARVLASMGHRNESIRAAEAAIALAPDAAVTYSTKAIVLAAAEFKPDHARASIARAVELAPDDADIRVDAARVALAQRDWAAAERHAQAALALDPDDELAMNLLGLALSEQRRPADALGYFVAAARSDPGGVGADQARRAARQIAGTEGFDLRRLWVVVLSALGAVWALALLPRAFVVPVFLGMTVVAIALFATWRRRRRDAYAALSEDDRALVDRARTDPSPVMVMALWTVLGVAGFIGGLYLLQIVAPPSDGATATPTQSAVVVSICAGVAAACWWKLRTFRPSDQE